MNFQVPQFIEEKAKIAGPFTLQQLLFLVGGAGLCFLCFALFTTSLAILFTVIIAPITLVIALAKFNGQNVPNLIKSAATYFWEPHTYTWQRKFAEQSLDVSAIDKIEQIRKNIGVQDRLKSIALSVTTGKIFKDFIPNSEQEKKDRFQVVTYLTGEKKAVHRVDYR